MPPSSPQSHLATPDIESTFMAAVLEYFPFRIYFKDDHNRFVAVGRQKLLWHGCTEADILGKTDADFFHSAHAQEALDEENSILRTGVPILNMEKQFTSPTGEVTSCLVNKMPVRDETGAVVGTFGYSEDITKEKEMTHSLQGIQTALVDASRMAGMAEVATGVLHNVGNVLNSLNVSSSIITTGLRQSKADSLAKLGQLLREHSEDLGKFLTEDPKGKKAPEFLESLSRHFSTERDRLLAEIEGMQKNIDHIKEIVSMQQTYASMAGMVEPLTAASLMEDAVRMNSGTLGRNQVKIVHDFQPVPNIMAEKGKVLQILVNLIRNSKHACDENARPEKVITLRVKEGEAGRVLLIVQDNGIGIPAENLLKVFQHGFTTKAEGHGFGVHSSANAAREMKGSLSVQSDGAGQGAQFILDLPVAEATARPNQTLPA